MSEPSSAQRRALLIVDHGTRSAEANLRLAAFAEQVASARPEWRVTHAHMELAQPDMPTAIDALVAEGAVEIHIHLHFLSAGYHVRETIPELVEAARARHTQMEESEREARIKERNRIDPELRLACRVRPTGDMTVRATYW